MSGPGSAAQDVQCASEDIAWIGSAETVDMFELDDFEPAAGLLHQQHVAM